MTTITDALRDIVNDLVNTGTVWCGPLPDNIDSKHTSNRGRIEGAAFSVLVLIDGDAGPGLMRVTPRGATEVDLGGEALHELFGADQACFENDEQRRFMVDLQQLVDRHADQDGPIDGVMGRFLNAVCGLLADGYEIRLVYTDWDSGEPVEEGVDVAPGLPAAFTAAWKRTVARSVKA